MTADGEPEKGIAEKVNANLIRHDTIIWLVHSCISVGMLLLLLFGSSQDARRNGTGGSTYFTRFIVLGEQDSLVKVVHLETLAASSK
jgi:hypothetical protein